ATALNSAAMIGRRIIEFIRNPFGRKFEQSVGARYTDVSLFRGPPDHLGEQLFDETLVFANAYTIEVAIREKVKGLPAVAERTNVAPFLSQSGSSELLATLTTYDLNPGNSKTSIFPILSKNLLFQ